MILHACRSTSMNSVVFCALVGMLVMSLVASEAAASDGSGPESMNSPSVEMAEASERATVDSSAERTGESRGLEPTFEPREPEKEPWYNSDYLFGMTRGVANSTIAPAGKAPLFVLTVPLDIVILPFALIGGFFG